MHTPATPFRPRRAIGAATALLAALPFLAAPATSARATTLSTAGPAITVDPGYGPPLTVIRITGSGFCPAPCSPVAISVNNSLYVAGGVTVDAQHRFTIDVRFPGGISPGPALIRAAQTDRSGHTLSAYGRYTVTTDIPAPTQYPAPTTTTLPGGLPPLGSSPESGRNSPSTSATSLSTGASATPDAARATPTPATPAAATPGATSAASDARGVLVPAVLGGGLLLVVLLGVLARRRRRR